MRLLLMLTASFPLGSGEDFISAELGSAFGFDRILVCPCSPKPGSVQTRELPGGVECRPVPKKAAGAAAYPAALLLPGVAAELFRLLFTGRLTAGKAHELLYFAKNAREIYRGLKASDFARGADDVVVYSYWFYDAAFAGALYARDLRRRNIRSVCVSRAHGFDIHSERAKYGYLPMRRFLFRHVDRIYPCSQDGAGCLIRESPRHASNVQVSYLGTRDGGVAPCRREPFHAVSCAYMVPVKRLSLILDALKETDFPVVWTHIGSGPLEGELRGRARDLPAQVSAEFAGQMENAKIPEYYRENGVSVFLNVSSSEGIPVSVMEACSCGIPVIATDVGGTGEIVKDGVNGFLLPADFSPRDLVEKLRLLRSMKEEDYGRLCESSRRIWEEKFSSEKNFRRFYEVIGK